VDVSQLNDRPAQPANNTIAKIAQAIDSLRMQDNSLALGLEQVTGIRKGGVAM